MIGLAKIGVSLLAAGAMHGAAPASHPHRYWWPAMDNCTVTTVVVKGALRATPYVICKATPDHWATTPPPPMHDSVPVDNPVVQQGIQDYCPYGPNGACPTGP